MSRDLRSPRLIPVAVAAFIVYTMTVGSYFYNWYVETKSEQVWLDTIASTAGLVALASIVTVVLAAVLQFLVRKR